MGSIELIETLRDNLDSATVWLATHPEHRGRGIGTALLEVAESAESAGRAAGRTTFLAESEVPAGATDAAEGFATRHGYAVGQTMLRSALTLPGDLELLEVLREGGAAAAEGDPAAYRIESVVGIPPEGWFEGLAEMQRRRPAGRPPSRRRTGTSTGCPGCSRRWQRRAGRR